MRLEIGGVNLGTPRLALAVRDCRGDETPLTRANLASLAARAAAGDRDQGKLLTAHPVAERLPVISRAGALLVYVPRQYQLYAVDLTIGFDAYQAKFSGRSRASLRRKMRRFAARSAGTIDWRQYASPRQMEEFHDAARALSARTYQERRLDLGLPASAAFLSDMRERAETGRVRGYLLFLDGEAVAYIYCPIDDGVLGYAHVGYDPRVADLSPGIVLQWRVLEALFAEGRHRLFDFTQGEGDHKRFFATTARPCANVFVLPPRRRLWAVAAAHLVCDAISSGGGATLERIGLKRWVRRMMRR